MLVVVGGHTRNIGKTSVVAGIIRALPERDWTAIKVTQFGHGICAASGGDCGCCLGENHPYAILQERRASDSDSGRFLSAGAQRSYWVRTAMGKLENAMPAIQEVRANSRNLIVESNSVVDFLKPDLFLMVLNFEKADFKPSSRRLLQQADACVVTGGNSGAPLWNGIPSALWMEKPRFVVVPPQYVTEELAGFVAAASPSACASV